LKYGWKQDENIGFPGNENYLKKIVPGLEALHGRSLKPLNSIKFHISGKIKEQLSINYGRTTKDIGTYI
jgi:hypothetical protein